MRCTEISTKSVRYAVDRKVREPLKYENLLSKGLKTDMILKTRINLEYLTGSKIKISRLPIRACLRNEFKRI